MGKINETVEAKVKEYEEAGHRRVKFGITTIDGVLTGKYMSLEKFKKVASGTGGYCDVIFGWDVMDELYDDKSLFTGWHTGYPDAKYELDLSSERVLNDEMGMPLFLGNMVDSKTGDLHPICPRSILRRVIGKAEEMGYKVNLGYEYEFFVFDENSESVREKNYQDLDYLTEGSFGYSMLRASTYSDIFNEFMDSMEDLGLNIESTHCETGPGAWESAIKYGPALRSADDAELFKTFSKVFFQKRDLMATFMARCSMDHMGSGGHVHQSVLDAKTGKTLFYDADGYANMSEIMKQYLAGQMKYVKAFLCLLAPNVNSFTRLIPGAWAPTSPTWSVDNRTAALRVVPGGENSLHIEHRVPGADANPYLVGAALIASGMLGIAEKLTLEDEIKGNVYEVQATFPPEKMFPSNLRDAYKNLEKSAAAKEWFGEEFVHHYAVTREWEVRQYEKEINDWQMKRYFEII